MTLFVFPVMLSAAYDQPATVSFRAAHGTAKTSDGDDVGRTGALTIAPVEGEPRRPGPPSASGTGGRPAFGAAAHTTVRTSV